MRHPLAPARRIYPEYLMRGQSEKEDPMRTLSLSPMTRFAEFAPRAL